MHRPSHLYKKGGTPSTHKKNRVTPSSLNTLHKLIVPLTTLNNVLPNGVRCSVRVCNMGQTVTISCHVYTINKQGCQGQDLIILMTAMRKEPKCEGLLRDNLYSEAVPKHPTAHRAPAVVLNRIVGAPPAPQPATVMRWGLVLEAAGCAPSIP